MLALQPVGASLRNY